MSGFTSFLKKAGQVIVEVAGLATGLNLSGLFASGSKAATVASEVTGDLGQIGQIVTLIEGAFTAVSTAQTGPAKLQAAAPMVSQIIQASSLLAGKKIADPVGFNKGVVDVTNGVVEILNACEPGNVASTTNTGAQAPSQTGAVPPPAAAPAATSAH